MLCLAFQSLNTENKVINKNEMKVTESEYREIQIPNLHLVVADEANYKTNTQVLFYYKKENYLVGKNSG